MCRAKLAHRKPCRGLASTMLSNVPVPNHVNCLVCAGFWGGEVLAVWLYERQTGTLSLGQGVDVGTLAGVWAGVFGFVLSLAGLAGAAALMKSFGSYLPPDAGIESLAAGPASVLFDIVGVSIVFGAIGGLIGGASFKTKPPAPAAVA